MDPEKRLIVHNKGRGAKYTKMRLPVKLVYIEEQPDRVTAMKRERAIKRMTREKKQKLISI
jgi:putative endonuclease